MTNVQDKKGYTKTIYEGEEGMHPLYHVAVINEVKTPRTNPGVLPNLD